jgi:hypothetical protein
MNANTRLIILLMVGFAMTGTGYWYYKFRYLPPKQKYQPRYTAV